MGKENNNLNTLSKLSINTKVTGDIVTDGDFRIDGVLEGNLLSKAKVIIGIKGNVIGDITCESLESEGKIKGKIKINDLLSLKSSSNIEGEIETGRIIIDNGTILNANCSMVDHNSNIEKKK